MSNVNHEQLELTLARLRGKYADYQEMDARPELRESDKDSIMESLIHRYVACFDTLSRHIRKNLADQQLLVHVPDSPKPLFRLAHETGLIDKEILERLFDYARTRVHIGDDYSMENTEDPLSKIDSFIQDASEVYETMVAWE